MSQITDTTDARTVYDKTLSLKNGRVKITITVDSDGTMDKTLRVDNNKIDVMWQYRDDIDAIRFIEEVGIDGQEIVGVKLPRPDDRQDLDEVLTQAANISKAYNYGDAADVGDVDERTLVYSETQGCTDYNKECNTDKVQTYLCPDGSVEVERVHLH